MTDASYYRLIVDSGENRGMVHPLRGETITIGRGPSNSIQLIDSRISREHVRLNLRDKAWWIEDTASKNGTSVNSDVLNDSRKLSSGDVIHVGNIRLIFESEFAHTAESDPKSDSTGVRVSGDLTGLSQRHRIEVDDTGSTALNVVSKDAGARLNSIYQIGQVIQSILDLDEMLERLMQIMVQDLKPTHAAIFLRDAKAGGLIPKCVHRPTGALQETTISQSLLQQTIEERVGVILDDPRSDVRFKNAQSIMGTLIDSVICVPLVSKDEVHGAIYLDLRGEGRRFQQEDLQWLVGVSAQAALAINIAHLHNERLEKKQRERDLEIARSIQMNLLPRKMPEIEGYRFGGVSRPALMVGGDYFDVMTPAEDKVVLSIADVSGKGIPAAILVASVRSAIRIESRSLPFEEIGTVVTRLNQAVCEETMSHMFVTMVLGVLDLASRELTFCNAGHCHPILRHPDGTIQQLQAGGCFLGIDEQMQIESETVSLTPGSLLVMYTDGVTDAVNPEGDIYGTERLLEFVNANHALDTDEFIEALEADVDRFQEGAEPFDDFTVLVVRAQ